MYTCTGGVRNSTMGSLPDLRKMLKRVEAMEEETRDGYDLQSSNWRSVIRIRSYFSSQTPPNSNAFDSPESCRSRSHSTPRNRHRRSTNADGRLQYIEKMMAEASSPASSRSTRSSFNAACRYQSAQPNSRHRDSMASSSGVSSVKQLIGVVRSTPSESRPVYSCRVNCMLTALAVAHLMLIAAIVPLFAYQSSIALWWLLPEGTPGHPAPYSLGANAGSSLLNMMFALGAVSSLFIAAVLKKLGPNYTLIICYSISCVFFSVHIHPTAISLIPGYILMGICLGPLAGARTTTVLMNFASKSTDVLVQEEEKGNEDSVCLSRREVIVHKVSCFLSVTQDLGLILGSALTAILLLYIPHTAEEIRDSRLAIDSMYAIEDGERVCGSSACPLQGYLDYNVAMTNSTRLLVLPCKTSGTLASVYVGFCIASLLVTILSIRCCLPSIRTKAYKNTASRMNFKTVAKGIQEMFKDHRLQLAAPLALFIGLEQGFMYSDFTKFYVVCALGISEVGLIFISMGVMQCIAHFTVNLVLQYMRRYYVIPVGCVFQGCLLLVLYRWKPAGDDRALFYVIAAAWGVCTTIWQTLSFTMILSQYTDTWQGPLGSFYFLQYSGLSLSLVMHGFVCNSIKVAALAFALLVASLSYWWLEYRLDKIRRLRRQQVTAI